jgi:hypothetical protein
MAHQKKSFQRFRQDDDHSSTRPRSRDRSIHHHESSNGSIPFLAHAHISLCGTPSFLFSFHLSLPLTSFFVLVCYWCGLCNTIDSRPCSLSCPCFNHELNSASIPTFTMTSLSLRVSSHISRLLGNISSDNCSPVLRDTSLQEIPPPHVTTRTFPPRPRNTPDPQPSNHSHITMVFRLQNPKPR